MGLVDLLLLVTLCDRVTRQIVDRVSTDSNRSKGGTRGQDFGALLALGDVDVGLADALRLEDGGSFLALRLHLHLHGVLDAGRQFDVACTGTANNNPSSPNPAACSGSLTDFVAQAGDAPGLGRLVDDLDDGDVEVFALAEHTVQVDLAQFRSHRRLRQLRDGEFGVLDAVARLVRVDDAQVEYSVDAQRHVIYDNHSSLLCRSISTGNDSFIAFPECPRECVAALATAKFP